MNAPTPLENNAISIRPMRSEDLAQVQTIDRLSFSMPWPGSAYEYELYENPLSLLWVAEAHMPEGEDQVVGMIVVWLIVDEAHIATIAVLPEYRGQGIARCLLVTALQEVIRRRFSDRHTGGAIGQSRRPEPVSAGLALQRLAFDPSITGIIMRML